MEKDYSNLTISDLTFINQELENVGEQVRHLCLHNCSFDTYNTLSLPGIFLNLKSLRWVSAVPARKLILPRPPVYSQQFKKWNQLEEITSITEEFNPLPILILESSKLTRLTSLVILSSNPEKPFFAAYFTELLECLKNTPAITILQLESITASPECLDDLHRYLPNLKILELTRFSFHGYNRPKVKKSPSVIKLEHLVIQFISFDGNESMDSDYLERNSGQIKSYLLYVNSNYSLLKHLSISFDNDARPVPFIRSVEEYVIKILSRLPHLHFYQFRLSPITDMILFTMDENKTELSDLTIYLEKYDIRRQFNFVLTSKQKDYITCLKIIDTVLSTRAVPNDILILDFVRNLKCLTSLKLDCQPKALNYSYELLIKIVNELSNLESLVISVFDNIQNPEIALDTYEINEISSIETLEVKFIGGSGDAMNKSRLEYLNNILEFVLKSCLDLRSFELFGELYFETFGTISLDLRQHEELENLIVGLDNVSYYTFEKSDDQPYIRYKNLGVQMNSKQMKELNPTYSVELLCDPNTKVYLHDAKSKTKSVY